MLLKGHGPDTTKKWPCPFPKEYFLGKNFVFSRDVARFSNLSGLVAIQENTEVKLACQETPIGIQFYHEKTQEIRQTE